MENGRGGRHVTLKSFYIAEKFFLNPAKRRRGEAGTVF
jgi:hypothetical protein